MGNFSVPRYGVVMHLPIKPSVKPSKKKASKKKAVAYTEPKRKEEKENKVKIKKSNVPKVSSSKRKEVFLKVSKPKKEQKKASKKELSRWCKGPRFVINWKEYVFESILLWKSVSNKYTLELTCEGITWKLSQSRKGFVIAQPFSNNRAVTIKRKTPIAKIYAAFDKLTWKMSFKDFISVARQYFPCNAIIQNPIFTSNSQNSTSDNVKSSMVKSEEKISTKEDLLRWFNNPRLVVSGEEYVFKHIALMQSGKRYVLVLSCEDVKWALRKNKEGKVSIFAFKNRNPIKIEKGTPNAKIKVFFANLTRGLPFDFLYLVVSKTIPREIITRRSFYLFDPANQPETTI